MLQLFPDGKESGENDDLKKGPQDEVKQRLLSTSKNDKYIEKKVIDEKSVSLHDHQFPLCSFSECPAYLAHNQFITDGYRVNYSFKKCILSLFRKHNETYNIWTHLLGFGLFFFLMIITPPFILKGAKADDIIVFLIFCIGAQIQMLASTLFHIFHCYSEKVYAYLARLDYCGISIMIVASYYPPFYYAFACYPTLRIVYLTLISVFGVVGVCVSSLSFFQTPRFRIFRTTFFIIFGLFAVIPMPHLTFLRGWSLMSGILWREALMGATYIGGACVYMSFAPERFAPGKFNFSCCSSHVLWHYFTTIAALGQYGTCIYLFKQKEMFGTCT